MSAVVAGTVHSLSSTALRSQQACSRANSFTGAITQKAGRVELADHSSPFLDEIGDLPLELQPKLLRVLQEREFERLGRVRTRKVDVRVIAATHRHLEEIVAERQFRIDLYSRLNVFPVQIPARWERLEDIPLLARHFAKQFAQRMNRTVEGTSPGMMQMLTAYTWPGNIRELPDFDCLEGREASFEFEFTAKNPCRYSQQRSPTSFVNRGYGLFFKPCASS